MYCGNAGRKTHLGKGLFRERQGSFPDLYPICKHPRMGTCQVGRAPSGEGHLPGGLTEERTEEVMYCGKA